MTTSPGAIVLLLVAVYFLLAFFTGRLEWLFAMGRDVQAAYHATPAPVAPSSPAIQSPVQTAWVPARG